MPVTKLQRAEKVFSAAVELAPEERAAFVRAECGDDGELAAQVQRLLEAHDQAGRFLDEPTLTGAAALLEGVRTQQPVPNFEELNTTIGPYKLLQKIGEGGFGSVYMAEQQTPVVRRVALKIIKLGMDTRQVIARFEAERQALAMMDHPNIARVFDAGATDSGRPYFVMELVRGDPVTKYCDAQQLNTRGRLELFQQICNAVQHAHQKGIIHRDIKPNNVLVTVADGRPIPKMIDFGIAKATSLRLTDKTLFTEHRQLIGTPQYMSPEQADSSGADLDTRSDIYSLGVLLYELLTGTTPFDPETLRSAALGEVQRIIREVEPAKPSTRLHTLGVSLDRVAARRGTDPSKLSGLMRGDLDWVVMKAMEKDRSRRYESASALVADIARHLAGEPVAAAPPGAAYKLRKFVRRHRVGVMAGAAVGAALVLGVIGTTVGMFWAIGAEREQNRLRGKAVEAQTLAEFEAFRSNLGGASAAIFAHDSKGAIERLELIPESRRGWEWQYLRRQADVSLDTFRGHAGWIRCLAVSPDGTLIASGADDGKVIIWDAATRTIVREFKAHPTHVNAVAWNPTGTRIATGAEGGGVRLWDSATGDRVQPDLAAPNEATHSGIVRSVAFSPDGSYFVSGSNDASIKIWDAKTGNQIGEAIKTGSMVGCLAFSPDGTLASAQASGTVLLWKLPLGTVDPITFATVRGNVSNVVFSPNGDRLAISWFGGQIIVYSVSTRQRLSVLDSGGNLNPGLAFSPDGRRLVSGGRDGVIRLWDPDASTPLATLIGHRGVVSAVSFSHDGTRIFSSSWDSTLKVWEAASDQGFSAGADAQRITSVAFSADGARIGGVFQDGRIRFWDSLVGGFGEERALTGGVVSFGGDQSIGTPLLFSPDGKYFATTARDNTIELSDADTGERVRVLHGHSDLIKCMAFNRGGTRLASGGLDRTVRLWDVATGAQIAEVPISDSATTGYLHSSVCYSVAFSPDDSMLAWGGLEAVTMCDRGSLTTLRTLRVPGAKGLSIVFNIDGSQLAVCAVSGEASLWDPHTGQQLVAADPGRALWLGTRASFSPDGTRLILSSDTSALRVFDTAERTELVALNLPAGGINLKTSFSPDGKRLVYGIWRGEGGVGVLDTIPEPERYRERQAIRAAEPEARSVLSKVLANETDFALAARSLRENAKLEAPVRRVALHLLLGLGLAEQEQICKLVDPLRKAHPIALELMEAIRSDASIPEPMRAKVIRFVSQEVRPGDHNVVAWNKVKSPGGSADDYGRGLIEAQEAVRLMPDRAAVINTLGVAQFRVGDYNAALATLTRADAMNSKPENPSNAGAPPGGLGDPTDVAFIAMTLHHLGRHDEAAAAMKRLGELMRELASQPKSAITPDSQAAQKEAEQLVRNP
jgi:WD40 repeat protein/serine/threonine protein kinase/tetratricopeptide (TPR) repeat protein